MTAKDHLDAGRLTESIAAATDDVRARPGDRVPRRLLAELLFLKGDLERSDKQFAVLDTADALDRATVWRWRQILRAEASRREVFADGRLPTFLEEPSTLLKSRLDVLVSLREGRPDEAREKWQRSRELEPAVTVKLDTGLTGLVQDADEICSGILEAFGADGEYYWVEFGQLSAIEFRPPARPGELAVRPAKWALASGQMGEVILPALYVNSAQSGDLFALGRLTDTPDAPVVRGVGQREWVVGEEPVPFLSVTRAEFTRG